jgi:hypothetical protein
LDGEALEEPGRDRIKLTHMAERELPKERSQGRGCVTGAKDLPHAAVAQHRHVLDGIGAGDHAAHEGGDLQSGVGALVRRNAQPLVGQTVQARFLGECQDRDQTRGRHEIRVIK